MNNIALLATKHYKTKQFLFDQRAMVIQKHAESWIRFAD